MSNPIPLLTPDQIAERIRACREELAALKKLQRMVQAAATAEGALLRRQGVATQHQPIQGERK